MLCGSVLRFHPEVSSCPDATKVFLTNPGWFIFVQPLPQFLSDESVSMEIILSYRFATEVVRLVNGYNLNSFGSGNHFRGQNH